MRPPLHCTAFLAGRETLDDLPQKEDDDDSSTDREKNRDQVLNAGQSIGRHGSGGGSHRGKNVSHKAPPLYSNQWKKKRMSLARI